MRIAFTADIHLDPGYPERAKALENVLQQVGGQLSQERRVEENSDKCVDK